MSSRPGRGGRFTSRPCTRRASHRRLYDLGRCLDEDPGRRSLPEQRCESLPLRADAALDDLSLLAQDAELAFQLVHVDANMLHGWPPPLRHMTARSLWGF